MSAHKWNLEEILELKRILTESNDIPTDIERFREKYAYDRIPNELYKFFDFLGVEQAAFSNVLFLGLKSRIMDEIENATQEKLLLLLQECFPYVMIEEFRDITLKILEMMDRIPKMYLKFISDTFELRSILGKRAFYQLCSFNPKVIADRVKEKVELSVELYEGYCDFNELSSKRDPALDDMIASLYEEDLFGSVDLLVYFARNILDAHARNTDHRLISLLLDVTSRFRDQHPLGRLSCIVQGCLEAGKVSNDNLGDILDIFESTEAGLAPLLAILVSFAYLLLREISKSVQLEVNEGSMPQENSRIKSLTVVAKSCMEFMSMAAVDGKFKRLHMQTDRILWNGWISSPTHRKIDIILDDDGLNKFYLLFATHLLSVKSYDGNNLDLDKEFIHTLKSDAFAKKLLEFHIIDIVSSGFFEIAKSILSNGVFSDVGYPNIAFIDALIVLCEHNIDASDIRLLMNMMESLFKVFSTFPDDNLFNYKLSTLLNSTKHLLSTMNTTFFHKILTDNLSDRGGNYGQTKAILNEISSYLSGNTEAPPI